MDKRVKDKDDRDDKAKAEPERGLVDRLKEKVAARRGEKDDEEPVPVPAPPAEADTSEEKPAGKPREEPKTRVFPLPRVEDNALYLKDGTILSLEGVTGTQIWQPLPGDDRVTFFALMHGHGVDAPVRVEHVGEGRELEALVTDWLKG